MPIGKPSISPQIQEALEAERRALDELREDKLARLIWPPKLRQWLNAQTKERLLCGANQIGKSTVVLAITVFHLTGRYPPWYTGPRFDRPIHLGLAGVTANSTRDLLTDRLFGPKESRGTGYLRASDVGEIVLAERGAEIDYAFVHHESGGLSRVSVFSYDQGPRRVQGRSLDVVIIDEAPKLEMIDELSQRINATNGYLYGGFMPQDEHANETVDLFEGCPNKLLREVTYYGVDDATWMPEEQRQMIKDKNRGSPLYQARVNGLPLSKASIVFDMNPDTYIEAPYVLGGKQIIGSDLAHTVGFTAFLRLVIETPPGNLPVIHVVQEWKGEGGRPEENAREALRMGADVVPVAWPHDGGWQMGGGVTLAELYRSLGLNMLPVAARMVGVDGKKHMSRLTIFSELVHRLCAGTLKISSECRGLLGEMSSFRFVPGTMKKKRYADDHLIDALCKAVMMLEYAQEATPPALPDPRKDQLAMYASRKHYDLFRRGRFR